MIQKIIGHGSISKIKKRQAYLLTINNKEGLIVLSNLINGQIRGPKYYQFLLLLKYLNKKYSDTSIKPISLNKSSLKEDAWLTGFIEADASFQVRTSINSKYPRFSLSFELCQSRITRYEYSTYDIIIEIARVIQTKVKEIRNDRNNPQYRVRTSRLKTNLNLRHYLIKFPLMGTKYIDFIDWCKVLHYFEENTHKENRCNIVKIKKQINDHREIFNWDHIHKFLYLSNSFFFTKKKIIKRCENC